MKTKSSVKKTKKTTKKNEKKNDPFSELVDLRSTRLENDLEKRGQSVWHFGRLVTMVAVKTTSGKETFYQVGIALVQRPYIGQSLREARSANARSDRFNGRDGANIAWTRASRSQHRYSKAEVLSLVLALDFLCLPIFEMRQRIEPSLGLRCEISGASSKMLSEIYEYELIRRRAAAHDQISKLIDLLDQGQLWTVRSAKRADQLSIFVSQEIESDASKTLPDALQSA